MVLSENNEPLRKNTSSGETASPNIEETPALPTPRSNPGRRLRSIEMAAILENRKKIRSGFSNYLKKVKIRKEKLLPAYHTVSSTISIIVNIILLSVILLLSREVFQLKRMVVRDVLGGLYMNFGEMDQASITTEIVVKDNILVDFPLQINQETEVVLTADTLISGARVTLSTGGLNIISAPTNIILPAGSRLPIQLNMTVPVSATVPISLNVPVNIPLSGTELHQPFTNLQKVVQPYLFTFMEGPFTWQEVPACKVFEFLCDWWFK